MIPWGWVGGLSYLGNAPEWTRTTTEKISPQGPQPCASTNSATGAEWASIAPAARGRRGPPQARTCIRPRRRYSANTCSFQAAVHRNRESADMDLTKRQQEIFDFIRKYSAKYGYPPTVRDIGKAVGLASSSTVHAHLANLEKIGLLRRDPSKPRAIELLDRAVGARSTACAGSCAPRACRCSARWRPGSRCWPRRTSRSTCRCPRSRAATTASTCCGFAATR